MVIRQRHINLQQVQNLQYHIYAFYFSMCCTDSYCTRWNKGVKYASPSTKRFFSIFVGIPQHQKGYLVYVPITRKIISSYDVVFDEIFSSALAYTSQPYSEAIMMPPEVTYTPCATSSRKKLAI